MLVLLPPSETKAPGGDGPPLHLDALSHPQLNPTRHTLVEALSTLATDVPASLAALKLSARQETEVHRNAELWHAPTMPALQRYTGVLYDALDIDTLSSDERSRADSRLAVASALFGLARGTDAIPAYRLSASNTVPAVGTLRALWRPVLEPVLKEHELIVDLRSGAYAALADAPNAISVRVLSEDGDGNRKVVSHHNKAHKGLLARALARSPEEPGDIDGVRTVAQDAGIDVEQEESELRIIVRN